MRLIDADALLKFPIRADRCDEENANEQFINGVETVMEYAKNLPTVDAIPISFIEKQEATALAYANYMREQASAAEATVLGLLFNQTADEVIDEYTDEATTLTMLITSWNKENDK